MNRLVVSLISKVRRSYVVLVLAVLGLVLFITIAGYAMRQDVTAFDRDILLAMRNPLDLSDPIGPPALEEFARDITALGGAGVLTLLTLSVAGYLLLIRKYRVLVLILLSVGGGALISTLLKELYGRVRPDIVPHQVYVVTASFPSGHSMLSAVTFLTLGALVARLHPYRRIKAYVIALAAVLTLLIGISRVYLGVHYPTDVLAGWTAGAVWALLCYLIARQLQRRGQIESPS